MIRVSFCLNAGPQTGVVQAAALSRPVTDELLKVAGNKLRLKKAEAARARLFVWGTGRELVRGAAAEGLANDTVIAVSLGEDYAGSVAAAAAPPPAAPEGCAAAAAHAGRSQARALHLACRSGNLQVVKKLAEQDGVSLTAEDNVGWQPIHVASYQGHLELVKWLAEQAGVTLTAEDSDGIQPIHMACSQGHLELVKWLAEQEGVSLTAEDNRGRQSIRYASHQGHLELVKWLVEQAGVMAALHESLYSSLTADLARPMKQWDHAAALDVLMRFTSSELVTSLPASAQQLLKVKLDKIEANILLASKLDSAKQGFQRLLSDGTLDASPMLNGERVVADELCVQVVTPDAAAALQSCRITCLDLQGNKCLVTLPARELCSIESLVSVQCGGCITTIPASVAERGGEEAMAALHESLYSSHMSQFATDVAGPMELEDHAAALDVLMRFTSSEHVTSLPAPTQKRLKVKLDKIEAGILDALCKKLRAEEVVPEQLSAEEKKILHKLRKIHISAKFKGVKVGLVQECCKHPKDNKLVVLQVWHDRDSTDLSQVFSNDNEVKVGMKVAFAPVGAEIFDEEHGFLNSVQAEKRKPLTSEGKLCSQNILGLVGLPENMLGLPRNFPVGMDVDEAYFRYTDVFEARKKEIVQAEKEEASRAEANKAKKLAASAKKAAETGEGGVERKDSAVSRKGKMRPVRATLGEKGFEKWVDPRVAKAAAREAERKQKEVADRHQKEGRSEDKETRECLDEADERLRKRKQEETLKGQTYTNVWIETCALLKETLGGKTANYRLPWMEGMPKLEFTANIEQEDEDEDKEDNDKLQQALRHSLAADNEKVDEPCIEESGSLDETAEGIEEDADTVTEEKSGSTPELPPLPLWWTGQVRKWYKNADARMTECFDQRIKKLSTRDWGRKIQKPLRGCWAQINEAYLDQGRSALRILWTLVKESGVSKILLWYVCKHNRVTHFMERIDDSLARLNRRAATADSVRDEKVEMSSLDGGALVIERDQLLPDPLANTPLKIWELTCADDIQKLKEEGWEPPLRLTPQEEDVIKHMGTVLVEGRSGTGKTICIANKMSFDRRQQSGCSHGQQLFVARSRRICHFVGTLQGYPHGFSGAHDTLGMKLQTLADLIKYVATALGLSDKFGAGARVDWYRFKSDIFLRARKSMKAGGGRLDALEVWKAMRSFIKGSICSLENDCAIDKDTYMGFGVKQVRLTERKRQEAFKAYACVSKLYRNEGLWDDCDLVLDIHRALREGPEEATRKLLGRFHKVYVDEVQDLTTAELSLLLKMSANGLFLAGDPAQSVEEGVDFRYAEVRSLFREQTSGEYVPEKPLKLHVNFRSHAGILEAADSILVWLSEFFPGSISQLPNDKGLCTGPRPAMDVWEMSRLSNSLLQNASSGLMVLTPDQNKENLSKKLLPSITVLGIREAKGLDFPEVVIVDFFSSLDEKQQESWKLLLGPKAVGFGDDHPEVETHLKLLYTAMTRAQQRLYFIETKQTKAASAFLKTLSSNERLTQGLKTLKANELSPDEWAARGLDFAWKASDDEASGLDQQIRDLDVAIDSFGRAGLAGAAYKQKAAVHKDVLSLLRKSQQTDQASSLPLLEQDKDTENKVAELVQRCIAEGMWKEANLFLSSLPSAWKYCLQPEFENVFMHRWEQNILPQDISGNAPS